MVSFARIAQALGKGRRERNKAEVVLVGRETLDSALINVDCEARKGRRGGEERLGWHQMEPGLVKGQGWPGLLLNRLQPQR